MTLNRLDGLRIHPESYGFAEKIALDAFGYGEAAAKTPVELWRDPAIGDGGGEDGAG